MPGTGESVRMVYGAMKVDLTARTVRLREKAVQLTKMECRLLCYLLQHPGQALSRQQILSEVWDSPSDLRTRTVDIHISHLRKKLGLNGLKTVAGSGYMLQPPREKEDAQQ